MSLDQKLINFIQSDQKLYTAKEIIFYGGSFNPWHDGHTACIKMAPQSSPLIIIPDNNPHKDLNQNKSLEVEVINNIIAHNNLNATVFLDFYQSSNKTPTVDWIKSLQDAFPEKKLSLLIGTDSLMNILSWKESTTLLTTLTSLYVVSRIDENYNIQAQVEKLKSKASELNLVFLGHHDFEDVSSSEIRSRKQD